MPSFTYFFCVVARLTSTSSLNQVLLFFFLSDLCGYSADRGSGTMVSSGMGVR